jgi:arsenate reductase-like glutaredoxin family protein
MYGIYAYPEQVFEIDTNDTGYPTMKNDWGYIYKVDDSVKKTDWWKNTLLKYRKERVKSLSYTEKELNELYKTDFTEYEKALEHNKEVYTTTMKPGEAENYLSTDELASYILLVENPNREKNGLPPYQAAKIKNIKDAASYGSRNELADDLIVFNDPRLMKSADNQNPTNDTHMNFSVSNKGTL